MIKKVERGHNYTESERDALADLIAERPIIAVKANDFSTIRMKNEAWESLTKEFNAKASGPNRSTESLKNQYDNLKTQAKKNKLKRRDI